MRTLEIRRHSLTKKGLDRGAGSHLSQDGVTLARRIGSSMEQFDRVVVSPIPRTLETALAMGFAVDEVIAELGPSDPALFAEIGHHERWSWESPFAEFARLVHLGGSTARLAELQIETWRKLFRDLPEHGRGLAISHGRVIECGAVACCTGVDFSNWGQPFRHCEGARITEGPNHDLRLELLRVDLDTSFSTATVSK